MGTALKIFLAGVALAGMTTLLMRQGGRGPVMQDDAGNPAPG